MSAQSMRRARRAIAPVAIGGAAVITVAAVGGVAVVSPETVAATMHGLTALIIEGNSTDTAGAGIEDFYQRHLADGREPVTIDFYTGPLSIHRAPGEDASGDDEVVSSGWEAAGAGSLLDHLDHAGDPVTGNAVHVLDDELAPPDAGFGTRYPTFGLTGVDPLIMPTSPGSEIVDVGDEYDLDGNAPAYVLNGVAMVNSLMAYLDRTGNSDEPDLPVGMDAGGAVVVREGCAAGCQTADAIDPALRTVVDYGYPGNDPLADPGEYASPRLVPRARETRTFVDDFSAAVRTGFDSLGVRERSNDEPPATRTSGPAQPSRPSDPPASHRSAPAPDRAAAEGGVAAG
ncbi:hypothetical protein JRC04_23335 [Mycolicibacterium sp. S2-37]|uniref:hypothetical protein n=1 Tax=Mycolicibacterium sp. S2-37 TaxID=2810297 RepID=UPI001A945308|nr:hypothetical protein [Mycolicibacterium sp. S2-37]MBO0680411.1 hypothetical protein [Mycolicibacterium sp. S2-37]